MVETTTEVLQPAAANEIVITRVFAAPRSMVWGALADPWQVGQWWGPVGFTTTILEMDLRAGGKWLPSAATGVGLLSISGMIRLAEYFIVNGNSGMQ